MFDTAAALHACPQWHSSLLLIHWKPSGWAQMDLPLPYMFLRTLHVISRHHRTKRKLRLEPRSPFARRKNMCGASVRSSYLVCALVKFIMIGCIFQWVTIRFPPRTSQDTPFPELKSFWYFDSISTKHEGYREVHSIIALSLRRSGYAPCDRKEHLESLQSASKSSQSTEAAKTLPARTRGSDGSDGNLLLRWHKMGDE